MKKIASPLDLQTELRQLLSHCEGQETLSRGRVAATLNSMADRLVMAMDSDERDLFDDLWLYASNYGDFYAKRDAEGAVKKAWLEWQKDASQRQRENFRAVKRKLVKDLAASWGEN